MTQQSNKSTSLSGLTKQYRLLKRELFQKASNGDLTNLLVLLGARKKDLPEQVYNILTVLAVSAVTEQLSERKRKGTYAPPQNFATSADSDPDTAEPDGTETVHGASEE